jgi:anti-sigma B factor antagonist
MDIQEQKNGNIDVVSVSGKLDAYSSTELEKKLDALINASRVKIVVNFDRLEYISSSGLRVLLATLKKVRKLNGDVKLSGLKPFIREVFDISGFTQLFAITEDVNSAVAGFSGS